MAAAMSDSWPGSQLWGVSSSLVVSSHFFRCSISFSPVQRQNRVGNGRAVLEKARRMVKVA